jgi:hypothetical protein
MEKSKEPKKDIATEMYKLCSDYCKVLDQLDKQPMHEILDKVSVTLMAVYKKTFSITRFQTKYENEPQHSLTEKQYNKICNSLKGLLEKKDNYAEIIDPNRPAMREIFQASIAEDLTDIYQDFYDFVQWYSEGTFESINDSVIELLNNFDKYWGIKLLNALRAIHIIRYLKKDASLFRDTLSDDDSDAAIFEGEEEDPEALSDFLKEEL